MPDWYFGTKTIRDVDPAAMEINVDFHLTLVVSPSCNLERGALVSDMMADIQITTSRCYSPTD